MSTYGLYIGHSAMPIKRGSKEDLHKEIPFLDPADRAQGWTIVPLSEREPWPRHVEGPCELNPWWLAAGVTFFVFAVWVFSNLAFPLK